MGFVFQKGYFGDGYVRNVFEGEYCIGYYYWCW